MYAKALPVLFVSAAAIAYLVTNQFASVEKGDRHEVTLNGSAALTPAEDASAGAAPPHLSPPSQPASAPLNSQTTPPEALERMEALLAEERLKRQDSIARVQAGMVIDVPIAKSLEENLNVAAPFMKPLDEAASQLTRSPISVGGALADARFIGALLGGNRTPEGYVELTRVYRDSELGLVILEEADLSYFSVQWDERALNQVVNDQPASLVKSRDESSGVELARLSWRDQGKLFAMQIGKIDDYSVYRLLEIANGLQD